MRALIVTKIFPNRLEPLSSPFNRQQFSELAKLCDVEILATIPWFPGARAFSKWSRAGRLLGVPRADRIGGIAVRHPRYLFVPRIGPALAGPLYAASLAKTALRYRGKVDVVLGSWAYPDGFAAVLLSEMLGIPAVIKLHGSDMNVVARLPGPRRLLTWALPRAARVVAVSRPLRDAALELGVQPDRIDLVPNGIDRARFLPRDRTAAREALGLPPSGPMVLYVGNVERHKGSIELIQAFAEVAAQRTDITFVIVGDGSAMNQCQKLAAELRVAVSFVGARPHAEVPEWLAACDVFTLPSWNEGTPNVVLEALACGRRVVATRVGGTPDVVNRAAFGTLVPPRDPHALALGLQQALSTPYDAEAVSAAFAAPDWRGSASLLHASLVRALERSAPKAA